MPRLISGPSTAASTRDHDCLEDFLFGVRPDGQTMLIQSAPASVVGWRGVEADRPRRCPRMPFPAAIQVVEEAVEVVRVLDVVLDPGPEGCSGL